MTYQRDDFRAVPSIPGVFYCPGCNASWDDQGMPTAPSCVCVQHGSGSGSLTAEGVESYLAEVSA